MLNQQNLQKIFIHTYKGVILLSFILCFCSINKAYLTIRKKIRGCWVLYNATILGEYFKKNSILQYFHGYQEILHLSEKQRRKLHPTGEQIPVSPVAD